MTGREIMENCLRVCTDDDHKDVFGLVMPDKGLLFTMQFGTDQLLPEDYEQGFTSYVDFYSYDVSDVLAEPKGLEKLIAMTDDDLYDADQMFEEADYGGLLLLTDEQAEQAHNNLARLIPTVLDFSDITVKNNGNVLDNNYPDVWCVGDWSRHYEPVKKSPESIKKTVEETREEEKTSGKTDGRTPEYVPVRALLDNLQESLTRAQYNKEHIGMDGVTKKRFREAEAQRALIEKAIGTPVQFTESGRVVVGNDKKDFTKVYPVDAEARTQERG